MQSIEIQEDRMSKHERRTYRAYLDAIGRTVGHHAPASKARRACPAEFAAWRAAFIAAYGTDPS